MLEEKFDNKEPPSLSPAQPSSLSSHPNISDLSAGVYGKTLREETHSDMICDCTEDVYKNYHTKALAPDERGKAEGEGYVIKITQYINTGYSQLHATQISAILTFPP